MKPIYINLMLMLLLSACMKDEPLKEDPYNTGGIAAVANNNFNLTLFSYAMQSSGYTAILSGKGPFTVIAPSNSAFNKIDIRSAEDVRNDGERLAGIIPYHILKGNVSFDTLALSSVHTFLMEDGLPIYVSRWQNSRDTAITANGVRLASAAISTTNGNLYLADNVLLPSTGDSLQSLLGNDVNLTFFNAAVMRSGFKFSGTYTIFAPSNQSFINIGIMTTDSIYKMDPIMLEQLLQAHITKGRHFINDYIFFADVTTNSYEEKMLDGSDTHIALLPVSGAPGRFRSISLSKSGITGNVIKENLTASDGVVHIIDNIFVP